MDCRGGGEGEWCRGPGAGAEETEGFDSADVTVQTAQWKPQRVRSRMGSGMVRSDPSWLVEVGEGEVEEPRL